MQDQLFNAGPVKITTGKRRVFPTEAGPCREPGCTNKARPKQGSRYCEDHARTNGYNPLSGTQPANCSRCDKPYRRIHRNIRQSEPIRAWHDFCPDCHRLSPLNSKQLTAHKVPYELTHKWLMQGDQLQCDLCPRPLRRKSGIAQPNIDHDHACCTGNSCGDCVRGILCTRCNVLVGSLEQILSDPQTAQRYTKYLQKASF